MIKPADALIVGVDIGLNGAWCLLNPYQRRPVQFFDMPTKHRTISGNDRKVVDFLRIRDLVRTLRDIGALLFVIEAPGSRPGQASGGAVTLGVGAGAIIATCVCEDAPYELVHANVWKRKMRVPADKWGAIQRADQFFPAYYNDFRGPRGGKMDGKAEAAIIALWGAENILEIRR